MITILSMGNYASNIDLTDTIAFTFALTSPIIIAIMAQPQNNPQDPFLEALLRIGLNQASADYLIQQDLNGTDRLLLFKDEEAIERMFENLNRRTLPAGVTFPYLATAKIVAFRHWAAARVRTGMQPDPAVYDNDQANSTLDRMREEQTIAKATKDADPKKPEALTNLVKWDAFWEQWTNYIGQLRGAAKIPLSYIHRDHDEVTDEIRGEAEEFMDDEDAVLAMLTIFSGEHYIIDNRRYYVEFKALIADGPGWPFIRAFDKTQNGRSAVLALKTQCEGLSYRLNKKAQAYKKIRELSFSGHRRNWTLQHYITGHLEAHNILEEMDESVPETKKVMDLLNGISDPLLRTAKDVCLGDVDKLSNFQTCQKFLTSVATNNRHFQRVERRISSVRRNNGRNNNQGATVTLSNGDRVPLSRIPPAKWNRMSRQDRNTVLQARRANNNRNRNRNNNNSGNGSGMNTTANTSSSSTQSTRSAAATRQDNAMQVDEQDQQQRQTAIDRTVAALSRVRFGRNAE